MKLPSWLDLMRSVFFDVICPKWLEMMSFVLLDNKILVSIFVKMFASESSKFRTNLEIQMSIN